MYKSPNFNNKTILITGGAGFIGSNLAFYFQENFPNSNIIIFDCFRSDKTFSNGNFTSFGHYKNLIGFKGDIICGNINNQTDLRLLNAYKFDYIFHQAAISDTRVYDQEIIMKTNVNSFYDLLAIAKKNGAIMVYASSAATYGNLPSPQTVGKENPENPYGFSKLLMDQIATRYSNENPNMTIVGLRFFNVYGNRMSLDGAYRLAIPIFASQIKEGKPCTIFNDGNQKRDFVHVDDVVDANILVANHKSSFKGDIYNVGSSTNYSINEIADMFGGEKEYGEKRIEPFETLGETLKSKKSLDFFAIPLG